MKNCTQTYAHADVKLRNFLSWPKREIMQFTYDRLAIFSQFLIRSFKMATKAAKKVKHVYHHLDKMYIWMSWVISSYFLLKTNPRWPPWCHNWKNFKVVQSAWNCLVVLWDLRIWSAYNYFQFYYTIWPDLGYWIY